MKIVRVIVGDSDVVDENAYIEIFDLQCDLVVERLRSLAEIGADDARFDSLVRRFDFFCNGVEFLPASADENDVDSATGEVRRVRFANAVRCAGNDCRKERASRDLTAPPPLLPAHLPNFRRKFVPRPSLGKTKQRSPEYSDRRKPVPTRKTVAAPAMRRANSYHVYAI